MVDKYEIFKLALSALICGDRTEAIHLFRSFADDLECGGGIDVGEIKYQVGLLHEELSDGEFEDYDGDSEQDELEGLNF